MGKKIDSMKMAQINEALEDTDDFEVQQIKQKYSKKTLNPLKKRSNAKQLIIEVEALLNYREQRRILEEKRLAKEQRKEAIAKSIHNTKSSIKKHPRISAAIAALLLLIMGGSYAYNKQKTTLKTINFNLPNEERFVGDSVDISYSVFPETAVYDNNDISVVFSNNHLVEYDKSSNNFDCIKDGKLVAKIYYKNQELDQKIIDIKPVLVSKLYLPDIEIGLGNSTELAPIIEPSNATNKDYTMTLDNTSIATLNGNTLNGLSLGDTTLHLKSQDGYSYDVNVSVVNIPPVVLSINGLKNNYVVGDSITPTVDFIPSTTTLKNVTWSSSDESIASVDENGMITANNKGVATITVAYDDNVKSSKEITIDYPAPTSISIQSPSNSLHVGESMKLAASFEPIVVSNDSVTWSSENNKIADVDADGNLIAYAAGTTVLTATSANGRKDTIEITVSENTPVTRSFEEQTPVEAPVGTAYVCNTNTHAFHYPSCKHVSRIKAKNRWDVTATRDEVTSWGYHSCKDCNP